MIHSHFTTECPGNRKKDDPVKSPGKHVIERPASSTLLVLISGRIIIYRMLSAEYTKFE